MQVMEGQRGRREESILEKSLYKDQNEWLWLLKTEAFLLLPVYRRTFVLYEV
jgi:hypothetical protein